MTKVRTLRKIDTPYVDPFTHSKSGPLHPVFEDFFTKEKFIYLVQDNSIYSRMRVGADALAILQKGVWAIFRERLTT